MVPSFLPRLILSDPRHLTQMSKGTQSSVKALAELLLAEGLLYTVDLQKESRKA